MSVSPRTTKPILPGHRVKSVNRIRHGATVWLVEYYRPHSLVGTLEQERRQAEISHVLDQLDTWVLRDPFSDRRPEQVWWLAPELMAPDPSGVRREMIEQMLWDVYKRAEEAAEQTLNDPARMRRILTRRQELAELYD